MFFNVFIQRVFSHKYVWWYLYYEDWWEKQGWSKTYKPRISLLIDWACKVWYDYWLFIIKLEKEFSLVRKPLIMNSQVSTGVRRLQFKNSCFSLFYVCIQYKKSFQSCGQQVCVSKSSLSLILFFWHLWPCANFS